MNLQRDVAKTGKPINIIQKLIEAEKNGGAKGQIKLASEWPEDNFNLVLSYTNEEQVFHAETPVELIGDEEVIEVTDKGSSQSDSASLESSIDQLSKVDSDQKSKSFNVSTHSIN